LEKAVVFLPADFRGLYVKPGEKMPVSRAAVGLANTIGEILYLKMSYRRASSGKTEQGY
jgi:hypothetical protein